ncbi:MAG: hypothetical protein Q9208_006957 [Pyrenodesmia sp. 3 TL-2023]
MSPTNESAAADEVGNPTVLPVRILQMFRFAFLIRHPRRSIPSLYRLSVPPLSSMTGWHGYLSSEEGYVELRQLFDFVRRVQGTTTGVAETEGTGSTAAAREICLIDADDLLDNPSGIPQRFCSLSNLEYSDDMLSWDTEEQQDLARTAFRKWKGFHEDVLKSTGLKARDHGLPQSTMTEGEEDEAWTREYGDEGAGIIRRAVDANIPHYEYLKQFALKA